MLKDGMGQLKMVQQKLMNSKLSVEVRCCFKRCGTIQTARAHAAHAISTTSLHAQRAFHRITTASPHYRVSRRSFCSAIDGCPVVGFCAVRVVAPLLVIVPFLVIAPLVFFWL